MKNNKDKEAKKAAEEDKKVTEATIDAAVQKADAAEAEAKKKELAKMEEANEAAEHHNEVWQIS
jgi:hypothetical protein